MPIAERQASALITVGPDGKAVDVQVTGTSKGVLNGEIAKHLKVRTHFNPNCSGKIIELKFVYRFGGTVRKNPSLRVAFQAPNTFVFEKEPGVAVIDNIPLKRN